MALTGNVNWEARPASGSDTACSGSFDPSQTAGMLTDGAATSATGASPTFSSASYTFVSGDVGAKVFVASGTNWAPGWYPIASVSGGNAVLDAAAGHATLLNNWISSGYLRNSSAGCATTASPTGATWSIDYSQQNSAQFSYTDLVIGATNTQLTSTAQPFGKQQVGNLIQVTSGSGFTTGWFCIQSVTTLVATMDRAVGTAASTSGHGYQGGAMASISAIAAQAIAGNWIYMTGTYTVTAIQALAFGSTSAARNFQIIGYSTYRGDAGQATWTTATNNISLIDISSLDAAAFVNIDFTNTAGTPGTGTNGNAIIPKTANATRVLFQKCSFSGFTIHINLDWQNVAFTCIFAIFDQCTFGVSASHGVINTACAYIVGCEFNQCGGDGYKVIESTNGNAGIGNVCFKGSVFYKCGAKGIESQQNGAAIGLYPNMIIDGCLFHSCTGDGVTTNGSGGANVTDARNNIFWNNGGYGINNPSGNVINSPAYGNAYGSNTSGARNNFPASVGGDIALTGDPCNSASTGDFSLNGTTGAGASCTGPGWQGVGA